MKGKNCFEKPAVDGILVCKSDKFFLHEDVTLSRARLGWLTFPPFLPHL
jgi:hypothetical protein